MCKYQHPNHNIKGCYYISDKAFNKKARRWIAAEKRYVARFNSGPTSD